MNFHLPFSELLAEWYGQLCLNGPNRPYRLDSKSEKGRWKLIFSSVLWRPYHMFSGFEMLHLVAICKGIIDVLGTCAMLDTNWNQSSSEKKFCIFWHCAVVSS